MIVVTPAYETMLNSGKYTDAEKVLLMRWLLDRSVQLPERLHGVAEIVGAEQDREDTAEEALERIRASNRERFRRYYDRHKRGRKNLTLDNVSNVRTNVRTPAVPSFPPHPPIIPTTPDDADASRTRTRTREDGDIPTLAAVLAFAADGVHHPQGKSYPAEWASDWYAYRMASTPPFHDKDGFAIRHWQQKMITDWQIRERDERKAAKPTATGRDGVRRGTFAPQNENKRGLD